MFLLLRRPTSDSSSRSRNGNGNFCSSQPVYGSYEKVAVALCRNIGRKGKGAVTNDNVLPDMRVRANLHVGTELRTVLHYRSRMYVLVHLNTNLKLET